jgi:hypothetical protein
MAKKTKILGLAGVFLIVLAIGFGSDVSISSAQNASLWSKQQRIPEYEVINYEQPPYLIADQNYTVHAFNSQFLELGNSNSQRAIYYRQWRVDIGWTLPTDILYDSSGGNLNLIGVATDQTGKVHLAFQSNTHEVYYTWAFLANAGNPIAWSPPLLLATESLSIRPGIPNIGSIATDQHGKNILVVYSGMQDGNGLYFTASNNGGLTWSESYPVYLTGDETKVVTEPKLDWGESGLFHLVWSTLLSSGFGEFGYYANFNPVTSFWDEPVRLDVPGIQTPSVIEHTDGVFVGYYHQNQNQVWWRRSTDNGKTWTPPNLISSKHVGRNGAVSFVVDSGGELHVFFAQRIDDNNHGMWHSIWMVTSWSNPEAVVRGPRKIDVIGGNGFDPNSARAIVSNGNVILITWGTDGGAGSNGAWYSYKRLNAPELPALPLPVPSVTMQSASTEEVLPLVTTAAGTATKPSAILGNPDDSPSSPLDAQSAILIGLIPALLLLAGVFLVRYLSHSRNT